MLIAEKGTMGVLSRMSESITPLLDGSAIQPLRLSKHRPGRCRTNGISPSSNNRGGPWDWIGSGKLVRKLDSDGQPILTTKAILLEQTYSVETGTVLTINTKKKKLYNGEKELKDISSALTPQKVEFIRAGGSYAIVFARSYRVLPPPPWGLNCSRCLLLPKRFPTKDRVSLRSKKYLIKTPSGYLKARFCMPVRRSGDG